MLPIDNDEDEAALETWRWQAGGGSFSTLVPDYRSYGHKIRLFCLWRAGNKRDHEDV